MGSTIGNAMLVRGVVALLLVRMEFLLRSPELEIVSKCGSAKAPGGDEIRHFLQTNDAM